MPEKAPAVRSRASQPKRRPQKKVALACAERPALVRGDAVVQRVLAAAIDELARVGYAALRIEDVAQRASVNKTTVYRRWPEKCALVRDALHGMSEKKAAPPETGCLRNDLLAVGRTIVDLSRSPRGRSLMRMMVAEGGDAELAAIKRGLRRERQIIPLAALRAAVARGEIREEADLQLLLDTFVGAVHHRLFFMNEPAGPLFLEQLVDLLLTGVRRCPKRWPVHDGGP